MIGLKMLIRVFFTIGAICAIATSCEKVTFVPPPPPDTTKYISFDTIIKPIFSKCTGCHGGVYNPNLKTDPYHELLNGPTEGTHAGQPYILRSDSLNPDGCEFFQWITTNADHIPRTTPADKANFRLWIKQGVRNN